MWQLLLPPRQQISIFKLGEKKTKKLCFVNSQKGEAENPEQSRQTNTAVKQPVVFN